MSVESEGIFEQQKNWGNEQNGFFWILGLLKCFNGFENSHTDWIGYLNMICGEKS